MTIEDGSAAEQFIKNITYQVDQIGTDFSNAVDHIKAVGDVQGIDPMNLEEPINAEGADLSNVLAELIGMYGVLQILKNQENKGNDNK